jgi:hypothetical protein
MPWHRLRLAPVRGFTTPFFMDSFYVDSYICPMKNGILLLLVYLGLNNSFAQVGGPSSYLSDANGNILKPGKSSDIVGTPYLNELYSRGKVTNMKGIVFEVERMRFNIAQNRVEYEFNGNAYELTIPHQSFRVTESTNDGVIVDRTFRNNFPAVEAQNEKSFYEVVYDGDTKLLRHYKIRIDEYAEPGSMTRTKHFNKIPSFYIYHPSKKTLTRISKKKEDLLEVFSDKKELVEQFMLEKKIMRKVSEDEILSVCMFYDHQE